MQGLITSLWLALAPPPSDADVVEPRDVVEVVEIAPEPATPEPAPPEPAPPEPAPSEPTLPVEPGQEQPRNVPRDELESPPPPPPPPPIRPELGQDQTVQIATKRARRSKRTPREPVARDRPRPRPQARPWGGQWRKWGAPLLSGMLPGLGQLANGQPPKGTLLIYGTIALLGGSVALYLSENDGSRPVGAEYVRLGSYGVLSTAVPMLWIYAIADAWRVAHDRDRQVEPAKDHRLRVSVARTATVGFRADTRRPGFYDEWTGALIGQVADRWSFGASDLTLKPEGWRIGVVQFGLRAGYRAYEGRRLWIELALGTAMQVRLARGQAPLDPELPKPGTTRHFGAIPYGQLDLRWFVIDRLSLDFSPRLSVPVTTRWYSSDRALPRFAPTLELGASASVYF